MIRILLFFFVFFQIIQVSTQNSSNWIVDLDTLENNLLQKEYLFTKFSKEEFKKHIYSLKKVKPHTREKKYWLLFDVLNKFNHQTVTLQTIGFDRLPFEIKKFNDNYYIIAIHPSFENILGHTLKKINDFPIKDILQRAETVNNINIKSFLEFYGFLKYGIVKLNLLSENKEIVEIELSIDKTEDLVRISPNKTPFYLQKQDRWFWQYGINFGQQVYFKYNIGLSKEFLHKIKDSLQLSEVSVARTYQLPLQSIYDAPTFDDFTQKLFNKFNKRRYKKLFIDFRNMKHGNVLVLANFIKKLKNTKRINKKNRLYILIDNSLSSAAIEMVFKLQKETKATVIGEKINGISCSSDKIKHFYLANSEFKIYYTSQNCISVIIKPDIKIQSTFSHFINGIDPILQKALNL